MILFTTWAFTTVLILATHMATALIIDRRLQFGIWVRLGLTVFIILGPLGLLLELVLLIRVRCDIRRQRMIEQEMCFRPAKGSDGAAIYLHNNKYA